MSEASKSEDGLSDVEFLEAALEKDPGNESIKNALETARHLQAETSRAIAEVLRGSSPQGAAIRHSSRIAKFKKESK